MKTIKCKNKEEYLIIQTILYKNDNSKFKYNPTNYEHYIEQNDNEWICINCNCDTCKENYDNLEIPDNIEPDPDDFCTLYIPAMKFIRQKKLESL